MNKLETMQEVNPVLVSAEELVDINNVKVNKELSKAERIAEFIKQIKNPYCFKCGDFTIKTKFSDNGLSMEDCLQSLLL